MNGRTVRLSRPSQMARSLGALVSSRVGVVVLLVGVTAVVTPLATSMGSSAAVGAAQGEEPGRVAQGSDQEDLAAAGRELYLTGCSSCHGPEGRGVTSDGEVQGPDIQDAGEAGAYFYLSTGRMPLGSSEEQPRRKRPAYDDAQIAALVAYVASLGDGPALPELEIDEDTDIAQGGAIYQENCQACHGASGAGGALSYGRAAPSLGSASQEEIATAVRIGPGQMPVFGPEVIADDDLDRLVGYVTYLENPEDPGGIPLGRVGPMPEGFVAWIVGMGALLTLLAWIGTRSPLARARHAQGSQEPGS